VGWATPVKMKKHSDRVKKKEPRGKKLQLKEVERQTRSNTIAKTSFRRDGKKEENTGREGEKGNKQKGREKDNLGGIANKPTLLVSPGLPSRGQYVLGGQKKKIKKRKSETR